MILTTTTTNKKKRTDLKIHKKKQNITKKTGELRERMRRRFDRSIDLDLIINREREEKKCSNIFRLGEYI